MVEVKVLGLKIGTASEARSNRLGYVMYLDYEPYGFMAKHIGRCENLGVNFTDGRFEIFERDGKYVKSLDIHNLMIKVC